MAIITVDQRSLAITETEIDALPRGIVRVNKAGNVLYYNEATRALVAAGVNFFAAAPLDAVRGLKEPFDRIAAHTEARIEAFSFVFQFAWGNREATFTIVRQAEDCLYIVITEKPVVGLTAQSLASKRACDTGVVLANLLAKAGGVAREGDGVAESRDQVLEHCAPRQLDAAPAKQAQIHRAA